jgi:hypothetical protein
MTNPTAATYIKGDPSASQFSGVTAGVVRVTNFLSNDSSAASDGILLDLNDRDYLKFSSLFLDVVRAGTASNYMVRLYTASWLSRFCSFTDCVFHSTVNGAGIYGDGAHPAVSIDLTLERCYFTTNLGLQIISVLTTAAYSLNVYVRSCIFEYGGIYLTTSGANVGQGEGPVEVYNCTFLKQSGVSAAWSFAATTPVSVRNCLFHSGYVLANQASQLSEDYNVLSANTVRYTVNAGANSKLGMPQIELGGFWLQNIETFRVYTPPSNSSVIGFGSNSFTPSGGDFYGNAFSSPPSVGAIEYSTLAAGGGLIVHPSMGGGMRG